MSQLLASATLIFIFNVAMESALFLKQSLLMGPASQNTPIPSTSLVTPGEYEGCPVN
jgi:hypothetical protein